MATSICISVFLSIGIISCSQSPRQADTISFEATTPCSDDIRKMMAIPEAGNCEMIKWDLTINKVSGIDSFRLRYTYSLPKQGTRGFTNGAVTNEFKGKYIEGKGIHGNKNANIYTLVATDPSLSLSFVRPDENLLHILTPEKKIICW